MSLGVREPAKMPNENIQTSTHTYTQTHKVARLTIHYVAWYLPNILLFHSDLHRQLNTLTLPLLTSVTWHSHLWLLLHTLKPMNFHSPETCTNTDQIYTMQNTYNFEWEKKKDNTGKHIGACVFGALLYLWH